MNRKTLSVLTILFAWLILPISTFGGCVAGINADGSIGSCNHTPPSLPPDPEEIDVYKGPTPEEIHRKIQEARDEREDKIFKRLLDDWEKQNEGDATASEINKQIFLQEQSSQQAKAKYRNEHGNNWNEAGISAYHDHDYGAALQYFREATYYMPDDDAIQDNTYDMREKTRKEAQDYLSSVTTALAIKSVSSKLLLFFPDPNVRMAAQQELAKETLKKIAEASAILAVNQHLNRGKIEPFKWETEEESEYREMMAKEHARVLEELKKLAFEEVDKNAMDMKDTLDNTTIKIKPGQAMEQLINLSYNGFE